MSVEGRELAACPHCGSQPWIGDIGSDGMPYWGICCQQDGCQIGDCEGANRDAIIARWNRRATPPDQSLRDALGKLADEWRETYCGNSMSSRAVTECAEQLRTLLAQASNASGTPTTKGE